MATPRENSLSLGHLTDTFAKQRQHRLKKSVNTPMLIQADRSDPQSHQHLRRMHLQQRLQELKERELTARQHNRQLLQQFDEAQDTLRGMFTLTANMKTIRVEYERYLEESAPRWQQQLKEQTQAAQRKRMEEVLKSCLKSAEDQVMKSSAGSTTKPQKSAPPQKHDYTQDGPPHLPYMQPAWQTHPHTQTPRFPIRAPHQPQGSSHVPPSSLPPPIFSHPFHLSHHQPWPRQSPPQPDWSWTAAMPPGSEALWGQLYTEEPPPEREALEMSRAPSSKGERGGGSGSSLLSQELDVKPVRLSGSPAESSDSSRESSRASGEKREKRGGSRRPSSDRERCSSQESSGSSSAIVVTAAVTAAKSSKSDASSEKSGTSGRGRRSAGLAVGPPRAEKVEKEEKRSNGEDSESPKEESQSTGEESRSEEEEGDQRPGAKSLSCKEESGSQEEEEGEEEEEEEEESGSVSLKIEEGGGGQGSSSEQSGEGVKEEDEAQDKDPGDGDEEEDDGEEKEESQGDEEQEVKGVEEMQEQESEEEGDEEEKSDRLKNEESGGEGSDDEQEDEKEGEGEEDKIEEEGESDEEEEEEQRGDEAGEPEEGDSEDSIISPQSKTKKMHIIPEEAGEDEEEDEDDEGTTGSSDSNENSDEDIDNLLAPQEQSQKNEEKNVKADEKVKETSDRVQIFQVETSPKRDHHSDSDEFDDFYD
ncbi:cilia- and flagella-associated protein 251-like [Acanthopagrus latus]|uniref:cilia- and flagella-associated protein 251-like n=1 Tax=Acanthopagrus latus TaxID=8177 RepID=UPI00187CF241|nr:cilia- and flagella-associated protein 251-like [Acanthopagrus latus]